MAKANCGVNVTKLGKYIKREKAKNRPVWLFGVTEGGDDMEYVLLVSSYLTLRVPRMLYGEIVQPCTLTDAPKNGEGKNLLGTGGDWSSMPDTVRRMVRDAEKPVYDTAFTVEIPAKKTVGGARIYTLEDGTAIAVDTEYAGIFTGEPRLHGSGYCGPVVFDGPYGVQGLVLPIRISAEKRECANAVCAAFLKTAGVAQAVA